MTWYFSYIGDLADPDFHWDNPADAPGHGNLPRQIVPAEKHLNVGISVSFVIREINSGARDGKRLDWGAWGLRIGGLQLAVLFGSDHAYASEIAALDPARDYVLVAGEGG
ncbi:hypothetical protein [Novosphingobium sp.]|uniref:hypothetical protein n=1 Tax=Novosphingobium sp. TaxID=1874826 RepID=UPI0038BC7493